MSSNVKLKRGIRTYTHHYAGRYIHFEGGVDYEVDGSLLMSLIPTKKFTIKSTDIPLIKVVTKKKRKRRKKRKKEFEE